nr:ATP-binding cassette domain-containing protein [Helcococcus sueciensis]
MSSIFLKNVNKSIKGMPILQDINLNLEEGKIYGFIGVNGSGKSMLFRAISGLIKIDSGSIEVFGEKIGKELSFPSNLGILIDEGGFWNDLTAFENLKNLAAIKQKVDNDTIRKTIERVGLNPDDKRIYRKFSLGMKQRLSIAQAIMESPNLLILDEPTNALDADGVELIYNILLEEKNKGTTILIASHNKEDIDNLSDRVFELYEGKIIGEK